MFGMLESLNWFAGTEATIVFVAAVVPLLSPSPSPLSPPPSSSILLNLVFVAVVAVAAVVPLL